MKSKKNKPSLDELDLSQIFNKWWKLKKAIFNLTISIGLLVSFILLLSNKAYINKEQEYISTVLKSDLGGNAQRVLSALKSQEFIQNALTSISLDIEIDEILNNMIILKAQDPLTLNIQDRIASFTTADIRKLSLSNVELAKLVEQLSNVSEELISINLYHRSLNISDQQSKNFIEALIQVVNKNLILKTSRETIFDLSFIHLEDLYESQNSGEQISRLTNIINTTQENLSLMRKNYKEVLVNIDLNYMSEFANTTQKILFEYGKSIGNYLALDTLDLQIKKKDRNINDLKNSLEYLIGQNNNRVIDSNKNKNTSSNDISTNSTQVDSEVFEKLLTIGGELSLNNFRLKTIEQIQNLQLQRNEIITQRELLNLKAVKSISNQNIDQIMKRTELLAKKNNELVTQIFAFIQPKTAVEILKTPELIQLNSKPLTEYAKIVLILTILGFFIISIIMIFSSGKKS